MVSAALSANNIANTPWTHASKYKKPWKGERSHRKHLRCEVGNGGHGRGGGEARRLAVASWAGEYDLYSFLGVERTSDGAEIRKAYRALQKRCHPDIAGPEGHDMAILLNQIYSLLSDPASRAAYDREISKLSEFHGYTGKPIYSRWLGPESEQRAVFVDEVKCIGCLKCALHATKTFSIESVYGRARVTSQWADLEDQIFKAIDTCPVDCISIVERSDLAALEYLMSKQPRSDVRMTGGNNVGVRIADVFQEVKKFQRKFDEMYNKASTKQEADIQRKSRTSTMDAIRNISDWLYWQKFSSAETRLSLADGSRRSVPPSSEKIREAAAKLRARQAADFYHSPTTSEEYWEPLVTPPTPANNSNSPSASVLPVLKMVNIKERNMDDVTGTQTTNHSRSNRVIIGIPLVMAVISATVIGSKGRGLSFSHGLQEHIGGHWVLEVVNSFELQVILAGITWFFLGLVVAALVGFIVEIGISRR